MSDAGRWTISISEEHFNDSERYDSLEEAKADLTAFAEEYDLEPGTEVFIGQIIVPNIELDGDDIGGRYFDGIFQRSFDVLTERASEQVDSEIVDTWPEWPNNEEIAELQQLVAEAINTWMHKHRKPNFFAIGHVVRWLVPERENV